MLKEILKALDDKLTSEDLDGIIEEVDTDGSGTLDFDGTKPAFCDVIASPLPSTLIGIAG